MGTSSCCWVEEDLRRHSYRHCRKTPRSQSYHSASLGSSTFRCGHLPILSTHLTAMASLANMNKERVSASRNRSDSDSHTSTSTSSAMSGTQASTAASSVTDDPRADFKGDVAVNDNLPTQKMLDACAEVDLLDSEGKKHSFKSLFTEKTGPSRHLVVFVRHFFCGVSIHFPDSKRKVANLRFYRTARSMYERSAPQSHPSRLSISRHPPPLRS